jgi:pimeloyl-ACP methyl ester carboxylesterase
MTPSHHKVRYLLGGAFHTMAFTAWGDPGATPVVCVHGLTRNGRDFDALAENLADRFRVICPDLPGRGASDWLPDPMLYQAQHYVSALAHLLATIDRNVAWVGTSLGGICGMVIAAAPGHSISKLVLNDIGPAIPAEALARIRDYMVASSASKLMDRFADIDAIERHLRIIHAPFGPLTNAQWAHLARVSARVLPDGHFAMHYDPAIAAPLRANPPTTVDMWAFWDRIDVPVLAIRGEDSDLLLPETLARMEASGAKSLIVPGTGHAPALMDSVQIEAVRAFLLA